MKLLTSLILVLALLPITVFADPVDKSAADEAELTALTQKNPNELEREIEKLEGSISKSSHKLELVSDYIRSIDDRSMGFKKSITGTVISVAVLAAFVATWHYAYREGWRLAGPGPWQGLTVFAIGAGSAYGSYHYVRGLIETILDMSDDRFITSLTVLAPNPSDDKDLEALRTIARGLNATQIQNQRRLRLTIQALAQKH